MIGLGRGKVPRGFSARKSPKKRPQTAQTAWTVEKILDFVRMIRGQPAGPHIMLVWAGPKQLHKDAMVPVGLVPSFTCSRAMFNLIGRPARRVMH